MSKPTPGPWQTVGADMFGAHTITQEEGGLDIAVVANLRGENEVAANARLIAAAPELLEAAQYLLDCLNEITGDPEYNYAEAVGDLEDAIAKAEHGDTQ